VCGRLPWGNGGETYQDSVAVDHRRSLLGDLSSGKKSGTGGKKGRTVLRLRLDRLYTPDGRKGKCISLEWIILSN